MGKNDFIFLSTLLIVVVFLGHFSLVLYGILEFRYSLFCVIYEYALKVSEGEHVV